ncbi:MAG: Dps family protein [Opitutales bacterium]
MSETDENLIEALNKDLANLHVFWVKLHNYHWNIQGHMFFTLHEKTEEYYNYIGEFYDDVAERILQKRGHPFASLKKYLGSTSIVEEDDRPCGPQELLEGVRDGFETLLADAKAIHSTADALDDVATSNMYEDHIQKLGTYIWMLRQAAS